MRPFVSEKTPDSRTSVARPASVYVYAVLAGPPRREALNWQPYPADLW
jgi:hypothetical protein